MKRKLWPWFAAIGVGAIVLASFIAGADDIRVTKEELQKKLKDNSVVIVDVRTGQDWSASEFKIDRSVRVRLDEVNTLASKYSKDRTLVFYCA